VLLQSEKAAKFKALMDSNREHLDKATKARTEKAQALAELVAEQEREHPEWSNVQIAKQLEADGCCHKSNGKPYTAQRIGQIRNDLRAALRKSGH
jgi:hypothetical protein